MKRFLILYLLNSIYYLKNKFIEFFMGCRALKNLGDNEVPGEEFEEENSSNFNKKMNKSNNSKGAFSNMNVCITGKFENKGIHDKGKLKPNDLKIFQDSVPKINLSNTKAEKDYEETKEKVNKNKNLLAPDESNSINSNSGISVDPDKLIAEAVPFDPSSLVKKRKVNINDEYEILNIIGRGAFGEVKKIKSKTTNKTFAMKVISKLLFKETDNLKSEIDILKTLDHPNILRIYEYF